MQAPTAANPEHHCCRTTALDQHELKRSSKVPLRHVISYGRERKALLLQITALDSTFLPSTDPYHRRRAAGQATPDGVMTGGDLY